LKPLAVKERNLEALWGWEEGGQGDANGDGAGAGDAAWLLPPMPAARTSFSAVLTTAGALGLSLPALAAPGGEASAA